MNITKSQYICVRFEDLGLLRIYVFLCGSHSGRLVHKAPHFKDLDVKR